MNQASIMKYPWRLHKRKKSIWSNWVLANHLKHAALWEVDAQNDAASYWRQILSLMNEFKQHILHRIGNGRGTLFWLDPWHPIGILKNVHGLSISQHNLNEKLEDYIIDGQWTWPQNDRVFDFIAHHIGGIIAQLNVEDRILWTVENNGNFFTSSAWEISRTHYHIWMERNVRVHQNGSKCEDVVFQKIMFEVKHRTLNAKKFMNDAKNRTICRAMCIDENILA